MNDYEPQSYSFFEGLEGQITNNYGGLSIDRITLHNFNEIYSPIGYEAISIAGGIWNFKDNLNGLDAAFSYDGSLYENSVHHGALELSGFLKDHMIKCPNQMIILGGYSQGAQVVGEALWMLEDEGLSELLTRIDHVALFGDPKFYGYSEVDGHKTRLPYVRGSVQSNQSGVLHARDPYLPSSVIDRSTSWCSNGDFICGGLVSTNYASAGVHSNIYQDSYIDHAALEIFIRLQDELAELSNQDVEIRRSQLPISGTTFDFAADIMLAFDTSRDMDKVLLGGSRFTLQKSFQRLRIEIPTIRSGLTLFNEYGRPGEQKPTWSIPLDLAGSTVVEPPLNYSPIQTAVGAHTLHRFWDGGGDLIDSMLGALEDTIRSSNWNQSTTNYLVYYTNTYGRDPEPVTNTATEHVVNAANEHNVTILPVFYPIRFDGPDTTDEQLQDARDFHWALAEGTGGHVTEFYPKYEGTNELYDIIMGSARAPEAKIVLGSPYIGDPTGTLKFEVGQKVTLSADQSSDPDSIIDTYEWDIDDDGVIDYTTSYIEHTYHQPYIGNITLTVTSRDGIQSRHIQPIEIRQDTDNLQNYNSPTTPIVSSSRSGNDLYLSWSLGDIDEHTTILEFIIGEQVYYANVNLLEFTIRDVPEDSFELTVTSHGPNGESEPFTTHIGEGQDSDTLVALPTYEVDTKQNSPTSESVVTDEPELIQNQQQEPSVIPVSVETLTQAVVTSQQQSTSSPQTLVSSKPAEITKVASATTSSTNLNPILGSNSPDSVEIRYRNLSWWWLLLLLIPALVWSLTKRYRIKLAKTD